MDYGAISSGDLLILGVLLIGLLVGKGAGMEQRVLSGYIVIALLSPASFALVACGYLVLCIIVKVAGLWVSFL